VDWLERRGGKIALGGKVTEELYEIAELKRYLTQLLRAGRAVAFPKDEVDAQKQWAANSGLCKSNDPHVIGLARVSGARVLYAEDPALWDDFRNPKLLCPPGRVYRTAKHRHLLDHAPPCRKATKRRQAPGRVR
jgi:hypothetical protein